MGVHVVIIQAPPAETPPIFVTQTNHQSYAKASKKETTNLTPSHPHHHHKKSIMSSRPQFSSPLTRDHLGQKQHRKKSKHKDPNHDWNEAKRAKLEAEEEEEKRLTSLLFGGGACGDNSASAWHDGDDDEVSADLDQDLQDNTNADLTADNNGALFQIDREAVGVESDEDQPEDFEHDEEAENGDEFSERKDQMASAWVDEDDEKITVSLTKSDRTKKLRSSMAEDEIQGSSYEQKLRDRHETTSAITSRTDWATLPRSEDDYSGSDSETEFTASKLLSSTAPLLANTRLQPNILNVIRCPDANVGHYNNSTVQAVQFHPGSDEDEPLMLTAGLDKTLRFFKINGTEGSEKVHGIHFPNLPIHTAAFLGDTGSVVVSGRRPFFYIYDAVAGKVRKAFHS